MLFTPFSTGQICLPLLPSKLLARASASGVKTKLPETLAFLAFALASLALFAFSIASFMSRSISLSMRLRSF